MVRLAIAGNPGIRLSTLEVERPGPSYTVDTIEELQRGLGGDHELFFILGWDCLAELPRWREPARLVAMCRLVAVFRVGYPVPDLNRLETAVPGLSRRVIVLKEPEINISSSVIRERVARGLSIQHLVPEAVAEYISQHQLYRAPD
jgi:nicotinate-nucleotide adenylyltransferase